MVQQPDQYDRTLKDWYWAEQGLCGHGGHSEGSDAQDGMCAADPSQLLS